jgi:phosphoenolpyruvate synthase/pyruvate phosphate dikinase
MKTQININSKQAIISLFLETKNNYLNIAELFMLQNYINKENNKTIHMNIRYEDIKQTVRYNEELFFMAEYCILLKKEQTELEKDKDKIPDDFSNLVKDYVDKTRKPMLPM